MARSLQPSKSLQIHFGPNTASGPWGFLQPLEHAVRGGKAQLSDSTSHMPSSAELLVYCQLFLLPQTQEATIQEGVHELSFKGDVGRAVTDHPIPN